MQEEKVLKLTEIDNKDNSSKNFLLGEWCKKYEEVIEKDKFNGFVQQHHWKNKTKRDKDIIYIENLYDELFIHLKNTLNSFQKEYSSVTKEVTLDEEIETTNKRLKKNKDKNG